jgi:hypothetical protein
MIPYRVDVSEIRKHLPSHLIRHFIRGVLDADGSISHSKSKTNGNKQRSVGFTVTKGMGDFILDYLLENEIIKKRIKLVPAHIGGLLDVYALGIGGNIQGERFLDHLYEDSTVFLDRKYETYINYKIEKGWLT